MFPHTITIYRHSIENNADVYTKQVVVGVYWNGSKSVAEGGKGASESDATTVITSPETAEGFGTAWAVQPKDRIIKGTGADIAALKDITGGFTVLTVQDNRCGSTVDNVTITGK